MELKEATKKILEWADIDDIADLPNKLMEELLNNDVAAFDRYNSFIGGLKIDWLQKSYQFFLADRGVGSKQQDYTPPSIARLVSAVSVTPGAETAYDCCAGSGALTIAAHELNNGLKFVCEELDENVIPFLLFNLALRNIDAVVLQGDVLKNKIFKAWRLTPTEKYSKAEPLDGYSLGKYDICISNPPYNIKWNPPGADNLFYKDDERFSYGVPRAGNANYAFVEHCLYHVKDSGSVVMILPKSVLKTSADIEKKIIKNLVSSQKINAVISLPDKLFESTSIATCIVKYRGASKDCMMLDARNLATKEIRYQRGEGSKSHTERIYHKEFNSFDGAAISKMAKALQDRTDEKGFSKRVELPRIKENEYILAPSRYIESPEEEKEHRSYADIITDLNRIVNERGALKLTINQTLADELGLHSLIANADLLKKSDESVDAINNSGLLQYLKLPPLDKPDRWLTVSKKRGEFKVENMDKDGISSILLLLMPQFILAFEQHIYYLNQEENRLLAEFRDAVLPDLMSGKIDVTQMEGCERHAFGGRK